MVTGSPAGPGLLAAAVLFVVGSLVRNWYGARRRMTAAGIRERVRAAV